MRENDLDTILQKSKQAVVSESEREAQRRSFVFGNTKIEFEALTHAVVNEIADNMARSSKKDE